MNLLLWHALNSLLTVWHCSDRQNDLSDGVNNGNVEDGPELSEEGVCQKCTKDAGEVAEEDEGMVNNGGSVLGLFSLVRGVRVLAQQVSQIERKDGFIRERGS